MTFENRHKWIRLHNDNNISARNNSVKNKPQRNGHQSVMLKYLQTTFDLESPSKTRTLKKTMSHTSQATETYE